MTGFSRLARVEVKLMLREGSAFITMVIPLFVLVIFGISVESGDTVLPAITMAIVVALKALYEVPTSLGAYRERGILRRISTTPASPAALLAAQLVVQVLLMAATVAILLTVATLALGLSLPKNAPWAALVFVLGTAAMFAIGLFIAAVTPNARVANGIGVLLYFPLAFLGGVTIPRDSMPQLLARIGEFTPLGAFRQALQDTWGGTAPQPLHLAVLAAYAVLVGLASARLFRWE